MKFFKNSKIEQVLETWQNIVKDKNSSIKDFIKVEKELIVSIIKEIEKKKTKTTSVLMGEVVDALQQYSKSLDQYADKGVQLFPNLLGQHCDFFPRLYSRLNTIKDLEKLVENHILSATLSISRKKLQIKQIVPEQQQTQYSPVVDSSRPTSSISVSSTISEVDELLAQCKDEVKLEQKEIDEDKFKKSLLTYRLLKLNNSDFLNDSINRWWIDLFKDTLEKQFKEDKFDTRYFLIADHDNKSRTCVLIALCEIDLERTLSFNQREQIASLARTLCDRGVCHPFPSSKFCAESCLTQSNSNFR